ncbi:MAG: AraD1 family protein [Gammaproteobacteria bacterium]
MRLIQFLDEGGRPRVGRVNDAGTAITVIAGHASTYELAAAAMAKRVTLEQEIATAGSLTADEPYAALLASARLLPPLAHADPAHCHVSGTGLTHLGSASTRDAMHMKVKSAEADAEALTDSMRMFQWGLERGRPPEGSAGAQPEWFYKGNGRIVVACGQPLIAPDFALDFGEEPEVVGLYLIAPDGRPMRLGFAIGNEFSDHVMERKNYLYLAHSKLRQCGVGPELLTGPLPRHLEGRSRICRGDIVRWEKPFLTGEQNMCHSLANLEFHHFKYAAHRVPGDVHLHFFGTATLSFADGIRVEPGDRFEIELPALGAALVNPLIVAPGGFMPGGVEVL